MDAEINTTALSKEELISALDIDLDLCDEEAGDKGLINSYSTFSDLIKWLKEAGNGTDSDSDDEGKKRHRK